MNTDTKTTKARLAADMASAEREITDASQVLALANELGNESWIELATARLAEFSGELDHIIERAIQAGFAPEDFDS